MSGLKPLTLRQQTLIVNNVIRACRNIENLNEQGYKFISLASGFIAHFNRYCFTQYYREDSVYSLREDILKNAESNYWKAFVPSDPNFEYYMSKAATYHAIVFYLKNGLLREEELRGAGRLIEYFNQYYLTFGKLHKVAL